MIHKLSHIILGQLEHHNQGGNLVSLSLMNTDRLYVLYVKNDEIKVFNQCLVDILEDIGIPEDIYLKYRREIISGIIIELGLRMNKRYKVQLFRTRHLSPVIIDKWLISY